jgi:hypothetical protein
MDPMRNDLPSGCFSWDLRQAFVSLGSADSTTPWCDVSGIRTLRIFCAWTEGSELAIFCFGEEVDVSYGPLAGPKRRLFFQESEMFPRAFFLAVYLSNCCVPEILGESLETGFCWGTQFLL